MIKYFKIHLLLFALLFSSCSFLEEYSQDLARVETWQDLDELLLGDGYLSPGEIRSKDYSSPTYENPNLQIIHFFADELLQNKEKVTGDHWGYAKTVFPFYTWQQDTGVNEEGKFVGGSEKPWNLLYKHLNCVNMVLGAINDVPRKTDEDIINSERVKGEAHFLRGAYYFLLVNLYAKPYDSATASNTPGVPLKLTDYVEDKEFARESVEKVYAQIEKDLLAAEKALANKSRASIYHADQTAVHLFLSRFYLHTHAWDKATEYAQKVLQSNGKLLDLNAVTPGNEVLTKNSPETIFSMGGYTVASLIRYYDSRPPAFVISDDLIALYDKDDLRLSRYIDYDKDGYSIFCKVDGKVANRPFEVSDCFLLRSSEAYLNLAEASVYNNDEATAKKILKEFLGTRKKGEIQLDLNKNELLDFIRDERAREFCLEGHRWFDLRRYTVAPYKWSKKINHPYIKFDERGKPHSTYTYVLEEYDDAYTLDIPRDIRTFQPSLGNNTRPNRTEKQ